ncbi:non-ribosomal peptide synthetase [Snuella sedimenti]|uniref:Amino acid adenylation domain-containing protein n=1 Tax=Snuella sedimenti TaxID=2798802 RepID=A0A8J7IJX7_9FLAO|nr:non-ribosomal peptide synthetase [Snuella sedimenti]MBJ6369616.1 amino acid adenylation domain-containing protein [Snuella sedimenti]
MRTKNIYEIIEFLESNGITLFVKENQLGIKRKKGNELSEHILATIKSNKKQLISILSSQKNQSQNKIKTASDYGLPETISNKRLKEFITSQIHQHKIVDIYSLGPLQQGLLFHSLYEDNTTAYIVQLQCDIVGEFSKASFEKAWEYLIKKHTILRTAIFTQSLELPVQCVYDCIKVPLIEIDYSVLSETYRDKKVDVFLENDRATGFSLEQAPLFRITLLKIKQNLTKMVFTNHHILWDGWSFSSLIKNFMTCYTQLERGGTLPEIILDDYGAHIRKISDNSESIGLSYWKNYLSKVTSPTYFPFLNNVAKRNKIFGNLDYKFILPEDLNKKLYTYTEQNRVTVNTLLQGVWSVLLSKYIVQETVVFGVTVSGRDSYIKGIEDKVGLYINTIPVCSTIKDDTKITDWLQELQNEHTVAREEYSYLSISSIESQSGLNKSLFDTVVVFENYPVEEITSESILEFNLENIKSIESTNYTLSLVILPSQKGITIKIGYNDANIDSEMIAKIKTHLQTLLESFVSGVEYVGDLQYLTTEEHAELLDLYNNTAVDYSQDETILSLFEFQVQKSSKAVAAVYEGQKLTYKELDERSNQLAHYLREKGVKDETFVPICVDRSLHMIVGMLGIVKAGGVYVPIDPDYPQERVDFILNDLKAEIVVTEHAFAEFFSESIEVVELDTIAETLETYPTVKTENTLKSDQLLYVIYTSGTTGTPKGVLITHENVTRLFYNDTSLFDFNENDVWSMFHSYNFDFSVWEMYGALLFGGKLVVVPKSYTKDPELFGSLLANEGVTILNQTPSSFSVLQERVLQNNLDLQVRYVIFGGEALHPQIVKDWKERYTACKMVNMYGITETTVHVTYKEITEKEIASNQSNIGVPIPTLGCVILDDSQKLVPTGVQGELYVTGAGLARGYLNREDLTKERFVTLEIGNESRKYYRSGDLVKINTDGELEYLGRKDDQVKIRGYRIELGEIESALDGLELVKQSVVIVKEDGSGNKQLVAYVIAESGVDNNLLHKELAAKLPDYMVPRLYMQVESFPLTSIGKIDKRALPAIDDSTYQTGGYVGPSNNIEAQLVAIWQDLLDLDRIGVTDNFFELGGHSLLGIRLVSIIKSQLDVSISIRDVFANSTIKELGRIVSHASSSLVPPIMAMERPDRIPLSYAQERLWFIDQLQGSVAYHIPAALRIEGSLDAELFSRAMRSLVTRHESLRTVFREENGIGYQYIKDSDGFEVSYIPELPTDVPSFIEQETRKVFDLANDYMLRVNVLKEGDSSHVIIFVMHHIASDGWSIPIFVNELEAYYESLLKGEESPLAELPIQYADYSIWQRGYLSGEVLKSKMMYWKDKLEESKPLELPIDYVRPAIQSTEGGIFEFMIDGSSQQKLQELSKENNATLFMTLLSVYKVLLYRYTGSLDISVGTPIANREQMEIAGLIGFFVNTLVLRDELKSDVSFLSLLKQVKETCLDAYAHQDIPFERIVDNLEIERDQSRTPLFQTLFALQNNEEVTGMSLGENKLEVLVQEFTTPKFDMTFNAVEMDNGIACSITYAKALFKEETIGRMAVHFNQLISSVLNDIDQSIDTLEILTDEEKADLLQNFGVSKVSYEEGKNIIDLFETQVQNTPESIALVFEGTKLTYKELDEKSNQVAHCLASHDITKEKLVPICMEPSLETIIGLLGILKSGGAYVPIDPIFPAERIAFILKDIEADIIVTSKSSNITFSGNNKYHLLYIDELEERLYPLSKLEVAISPSDLAYVIYTSGTTGNPKGVLIEHHSVLDHIYGLYNRTNIKKCKSFALTATISADAVVSIIFPPLFDGGTLHVLAKETIVNAEKMSNLHFDCIKIVPSYWYSLQSEKFTFLPKKCLIFGGEELKEEMLLFLKEKKYSGDVYNHYGPTETTVGKLIKKIDLYNPLQKISLGTPFSNTEVYVIGENNELCPIGVVGELCISGQGLARGYLNQPELTREKFIPHPFKDNKKIYKTGDLVRWLPNGEIDFIGRKDNQVKIRGYRIELGEIESALDELEIVKQSVVIVKEDGSGNKQLVAYVIAESGVDNQFLQKELASKLPDYMVPRLYMQMESFPLTSNGKIDKRALPAIDDSTYQTGVYVGPSNDIEAQLVAVWQDLLDIDRIGVTDNFFELGGDSIKAIQLVSRSKSLGIHYQVKDIFSHQTISEISLHLREANEIIKESGVLEGEVVLHPIQRQFFDANYTAYNHYNQSVLLNVSKSITEEILGIAISKLLAHHDVLRLQYAYDEGTMYPVQRYGAYEQELIVENVKSLEEVTPICNKYQVDLDILRGDVTRFVWIKTSEEEKENRLFIGVHHLAIDGVSWRILLEDLTNIIEDFQEGKEASLPEKGTSYRQWTMSLKDYAGSLALEGEYKYWKRVLSNYVPLPVDKDYGQSISFEGVNNYSVKLDTLSTEALMKDIHGIYGTEINDILLSALSIALEGWLDTEKVVIGLEGHGREELFEGIDLTRTLGWFTTIYPVCLDVKGKEELGLLIADVKDMLRGVPNKGIGYSVLRYLGKEEVQEALDMDYQEIVFNYLGSFDNSVSKEVDSLIGFARESSGKTISVGNTYSHKMSINSMIVDGCLQLDWSYDSKRYNRQTIEALANKYIRSLEDIIAHCRDIDYKITTVSDYSLPLSVTNKNLLDFKSVLNPQGELVDIYPLSPLQEGLLFHSLYGGEDTGAYIVQFQCDLVGRFSKEIFRKSWAYLMERHTILRTAIFVEGLDLPVQCVYNQVKVPITEIDYSTLSREELLASMEEFLEKDRVLGFILEQASLFRVTLINIGDGRTRMVFTNHHILWDGWSLSNLIHSFMLCYNKFETEGVFPDLPLDNYGTHIRQISSKNKDEGLVYWRDYLSSITSPTYLPFISDVSKRNRVFGNKEKEFVFRGAIQSFTEKHRITVNTLIQGVWSYLLSKYTGQEDVVFGAIISGRDSGIKNVEKKVGLYINTIPVCSTISNDLKVVDWLQALQDGHTTGREEYGYLPLSSIESQSSIKGTLFDSLLVFENYPAEEISSGESSAKFMIENAKGIESTNYTLSLIIIPSSEGITIRFGYNEGVISDEKIRMIQDHLEELLKSFLNGATKISELNYLPQEGRYQLLETFNNTTVNYPADKTVLDYFKEQVLKSPESIAIVFGDSQLTYKELDDLSNQLGHYLIEIGVEKETLVPICLDRSLNMIVGILGVLKSGGAYVPIDPKYPKDRIGFMLEDISAKIILSTRSFAELFTHFKLELLTVFLDDFSKGLELSEEPLDVIVDANQLAYVIYTSGTTGVPKGVMIEHKSLNNFLNGFSELYSFSASTRFGLKTNYAFDVSVHEIFGWVKCGGSLVILPRNAEKEVKCIIESIQKYKITHLNLVPSLFSVLLEELQETDKEALSSLKYFFLAGEALPVSLVRDYHELGFDAKLENIYGPTEATIYSSYFSTENLTEDQTSIPIGKPVPNTQLYVLDEQLSLLPQGIIGELCIGGVQVARGYLNQEELTKEKFVSNPFIEGERIYKTGDLARWLPDGELEYLGRKDDQVKIRGYRIELGEITAALDQIEGIKQSVVLAKEDVGGNKLLVAYVVSEEKVDGKSIEGHLKSKLPEYMVPKFYMQLEAFPLNANGKVDRKALPELDEGVYSKEKYEKPTNEVEKMLVEIWQQLLGVEQVGIHDNFFSLGGDSIITIQLVSRVKRKGYVFTPKDVFEHQTIRNIANYTLRKTDEKNSTEQGVLEGDVSMLPIQKLFLENEYPEMKHYNQSLLLSIEKVISSEKIEVVVEMLMKRHDAFRLAFKKSNAIWIQQYTKNISTLQYEDLTNAAQEELSEKITEICERYQSSFIFETAEVVKFVFIETPNSTTKNRLFIVAHHLIIDGVSWRIILDDINDALQQIADNKPVQLGEKGSSYRQFSEALINYSKSNRFGAQKFYWETIANNFTSLPVDHEDEVSTMKDLESFHISLNKNATQALIKDVHRTYSTEMNDILLGALVSSITKYFSVNKISIGVEGHGREDIFEYIDVSNTVGWFTNIYPLILNSSEVNSISELIKSTKEQIRQVPEKGIGYGILRYFSEDEALQKTLENISWDIEFNYLGQLDNALVTNKWLSVASEFPGENVHKNTPLKTRLAVNSFIANDTLQLSFEYSKKTYNTETIEAIGKAYLDALETIIAHCVEETSTIKTPSDYELQGKISYQELDSLFINARENANTITDVYELSPMQEGMLFHGLYDDDSFSYINQIVIGFPESLNLEALEKVFNNVLKSYSILRSGFFYQNISTPIQTVYNRVVMPIKMVDYTKLSEEETVLTVAKFIEEDQKTKFNFNRPPLMRITLLHLPDKSYKMVWTYHHIILDGWSMSILMNDLLETYESFNKGYILEDKEEDLYQEYIQYLRSKDKREEESYWKDYLHNIKEGSLLPFISKEVDRNKGIGNFKSDYLSFNTEITIRLKDYCKAHRITTNTLIQGAWAYLLSKYTAKESVVYGVAVSGRPSDFKNVEKRVGLYINTIPLQVTIDDNQLIQDFLKQIQKGHTESREYQHSPLSDIKKWSGIQNEFFDSLFVFENYPVDRSGNQDTTLGTISMDVKEKANYPIIIESVVANTLNFKIDYNASILIQKDVVRVKTHLQTLLESFVSGVEYVGDLQYLTTEEHAELLDLYNNTAVDYSQDETILSLFEFQVQKSSKAVAAVYEDQKLTYKELDERSNQLAHYLREKGVKDETFVPICVDRSLHMIVGMLGIVKAGGVYVPIDPDYPQERVDFILNDLKAEIVVTEHAFAEFFSESIGVVELDTIAETLETYPTVKTENTLKSDQLLYVIYTSGTTGTPKGVLITHENVTRLFYNDNSLFDFNENDVWSMFHSYNFDFSVWEMYGALLFGGKLVVVPKSYTKDPELFGSLLANEGVTILNQTPSSFSVLQERVLQNNPDLQVRYVIFGGEALHPQIVKDWKERYTACKMVNMYGITETTVHVTYKEITEKEIASNQSNIGVPIPTLGCVILDDSQKLVPTGVQGELYVTGAGLARGYLNREDLTKERFVTLEIGNESRRYYRSGDLVKINTDGELEYLGRKDDQVKIRGYRIELGEINTILNKSEHIKKGVTLAQKDDSGIARLLAFIIPAENYQKMTVLAYLRAKLPSYMVPSILIELSEFPVTSNGKIDKKNLLQRETTVQSVIPFIAPRNEMEIQLADIWKKVLKMQKIGVNDSFFGIGGNSIDVIKLVSEIQKEFEINIPLRVLFDIDNIADLTKYIKLVQLEKEDNQNLKVYDL